MKRHGDLWNKIIDKDNLLLAFKKAKRHKSWQQKVIKVEQNLEEMIEKLRESLINGTYKTSGYRQKKIYEPKERTIYILPFYPDRIVHHAIMNILEPIWDKLFISHSYACRKNKGQHKGSIKCMEYVRKNRFCLKCDISKFYPSINHEILKRIIRKKIKCKRTIKLLDEIIDSIDSPTNVPIGNYLIFSNDKQFLKDMSVKIEEFVTTKLKLKLSKCNILSTSQGVDFLGYRHFSAGYILVRKSTAKRMKKNIKALKYKLAVKKISKESALSTVASVEGWLKWANAYNLKKSLQLEDLKKSIGGSVGE